MTHEDIVRSLLAYLRSVTARPDLAYDEAPTRMSGGFDATILRFSLQSAPDPFSRPLVLRLFQATATADRAPREGAVQNALAQLGYPAPRVFAAEARIEPLGGPFLIMERMPGRVIGSELEGLSIKGIGIGQTLNILRQLPRIRREVLRLWDEAQTRLHAIPVKGFRRSGCERRRPSRKFYFRFRVLAPARLGRTVWPQRTASRRRLAHGQHAAPIAGGYLSRRLSAVQRSFRQWPPDRRDRLGKATIAEPAFDYGAVIAILATVPIRVPAGVLNAARADEQPGAHALASMWNHAGNRGGPALLPGIQLPRSAGHRRQEPRARKPDAGRIQPPSASRTW